MRIVKAIAIVLIGPLLGMLLAAILARFALPSDGPPGDGVLIIIYSLISLVASVPLSLSIAVVFWLRSGQVESPHSLPKVYPTRIQNSPLPQFGSDSQNWASRIKY